AAPVAPVAPEPAATSPSLPPPSAPRAETSPAPAAIFGKPVETPKPVDARKPATSTVKPGTDTPKMTMAVDPTKPAAPKFAPKPSAAASKSTDGSYWVQVGAYKNQATAKAVAARLREQN